MKAHPPPRWKGALTAPLLFGVCTLLAGRLSAEQPLSQDDITLLPRRGTTAERLISLVEQGGVGVQMGPDLTWRSGDLGASQALLGAVGKAPAKLKETPPRALPLSWMKSSAGSQGQVNSSSKTGTPLNPGADLSDPNPERIDKIIQEFARHEELFKKARDNYAYHQINKVEELNVDGKVVGSYEQDWDILYDDSGKRIERVTYSPESTLRTLSVSAEDLEAMRSVQPFVLTTEELPDYRVAYLGHVKVDEITAYVFSVHPKAIKKGRVYFQGTVWVDDRDLQVVKSDGKTVPEARPKKGQFNLFPRFTTFREQIDGKYWFPTFTMADDTLYFPSGPVRLREIIKYAEYKQFKASSNLRLVPEQASPNPPPRP